MSTLYLSSNAPGSSRFNAIVNPIFVNLCAPETKTAGCSALTSLVSSMVRELTLEDFDAFMSIVYDSIQKLVNSKFTNSYEGGLAAIDALVGVTYHESGGRKFIRLASFLQVCIGRTIEDSARVTGRLLNDKNNKVHATDFIEFELNRALEWLEESLSIHEKSRVLGLLMLEQLATHAPFSFASYLETYFNLIWSCITDARITVRKAASQSLKVAAEVTSQRGGDARETFLVPILTQAVKLRDPNSKMTALIHGGVLTVGCIMDENLSNHFDNACAFLFKAREHKDKIVRRGVFWTLTRLVGACPESLKEKFFRACISHIIAAVKRVNESTLLVKRGSDAPDACMTLCYLCKKMGSNITPFLPSIFEVLELVYDQADARLQKEILASISTFSETLGEEMTGYIKRILPKLMNRPLDMNLVTCFSKLCRFVPSFFPVIQENLLQRISMILSGEPFYYPGTPQNCRPKKHSSNASSSSAASTNASTPIPVPLHSIVSTSSSMSIPIMRSSGSEPGTPTRELPLRNSGANSPAIMSASNLNRTGNYIKERMGRLSVNDIVVALSALEGFEISAIVLIELLENVVVQYLDHKSPEVRIQAALTVIAIFNVPDNIEVPSFWHVIQVGMRLLTRVISVGVADPDPYVRLQVLTNLNNPFFMRYLQTESSIKALGFALNDESYSVREWMIAMMGAIANVNPAFVHSALRRKLIQLITRLNCSQDRLAIEESARLLSKMLHSCRHIGTPYAEPIIQALVRHVADANSALITSVLCAVADVCRVGGPQVRPYAVKVLPCILEVIKDVSNTAKRGAALTALVNMASYCGYVIHPYLDFPNTLRVGIELMKTERLASIRRLTLRALGSMGAIDPFKYGLNDMRVRQKLDYDAFTVPDPEHSKRTPTAAELLKSLSPSAEDYCHLVAVNATFKHLREPTISTLHVQLVQILVNHILKNVGSNLLPRLLEEVFSVLQTVIKTCVAGQRRYILQQIAGLITISRLHLRPFIGIIGKILTENWDDQENLSAAIHIVQALALHCPDLYRPQLTSDLSILTPRIISSGDNEALLQLLVSFRVLSSQLGNELDIVIPAVSQLISKEDLVSEVRVAAVNTAARLCKVLDCSEHASTLVHAMVRILGNEEFDENLLTASLELIHIIARRLGAEFGVFMPLVSQGKWSSRLVHPESQIHVLATEHLEGEEELEEGDYLRSYDIVNQGHLPSNTSDFVTTSPPPTSLGSVNFSGASDHFAPGSPSQDYAVGKSMQKQLSALNILRHIELPLQHTADDWLQWLRSFSLEVVKMSPAASLRALRLAAQSHPPLALDIFEASFLSVWREQIPQQQTDVVETLVKILENPVVPPQVIQSILNLAEFMERANCPFDISPVRMGMYASKQGSFAKALRYLEPEFRRQPTTELTDALIHIYDRLFKPTSASGVLSVAMASGQEMRIDWYEKVEQWREGLAAYQEETKKNPIRVENYLGQMRCLSAMGSWEGVVTVAEMAFQMFPDQEDRRDIASLWTMALSNLSDWDSLQNLCNKVSPSDAIGDAHHSLLHIRNGNFDQARYHIENALKRIDAQYIAAASESYGRAYPLGVLLQMLQEMEEIMEYMQGSTTEDRKAVLRDIWRDRLNGVEATVHTWAQLVPIRALVLPAEDIRSIRLKLSSICRSSGRLGLSEFILTQLAGCPISEAVKEDSTVHPSVQFHILRHMYSTGREIDSVRCGCVLLDNLTGKDAADPQLVSDVCLRLGRFFSFRKDLVVADRPGESVDPVQYQLRALSFYQQSTSYSPTWHQAWHEWAMANMQLVQAFQRLGKKFDDFEDYVLGVIHGCFQSIALVPAELTEQTIQDSLRILYVWFTFGENDSVRAGLEAGFTKVCVDIWLNVIPQLIARIDIAIEPVKVQLHRLLRFLGDAHPQALIGPLIVASKSQERRRRHAAREVLDYVRQNDPLLVHSSVMVCEELIRVAMLWHELWKDGLDEASRFYFDHGDIDNMWVTLKPLHALMEEGPETMQEMAFHSTYGADLSEAKNWVQKYFKTRRSKDIKYAWEVYLHVFKGIQRQIQALKSLDLETVSPKLQEAVDLAVGVPGTYHPSRPVLTIQSFARTIPVIGSKQRPRKLTLWGSDGKPYTFLLKGHEDIRQDERVMQFFGLVNVILAKSIETSKYHLRIQRFSVFPLSPNSGLIGWIPLHDTMNELIKSYRQNSGIVINIEHRTIKKFCADYETRPLINRVEIFEEGLNCTPGMDLDHIMWLTSKSSETWLRHRDEFTNSIAVMSIVGYILGLGDRHPANLMIHRPSGIVTHIDFGDCFEVAMQRERYPEKVPFRLTRMMINAMEPGARNGQFKMIAELTMATMRSTQDSLLAVLEAFAYDPLLSWRLLSNTEDLAAICPPSSASAEPSGKLDDQISNSSTYRKVAANFVDDTVNKHARAIIERVSSKLLGKEFGVKVLKVSEQVNRLIEEATNPENLSLCYDGWCPYW